MLNQHWQITNDSFGVAELNLIHALLSIPLAQDLASLISDQGEVTAVKTFDVTAPTVFECTNLAIPGTVAGNAQPPFICYMIKLQTAQWNFPGGYKHVMGVSSAALFNGVFQQSFLPGHSAYPHRLQSSPVLIGVSLEKVIWTRPSLAFPTGRTSTWSVTHFRDISTQRSRSGRANAALLAAFC